MSGYFQPKTYAFICELGAGPFYSPAMGGNFENGHVAIEYYDADPFSGGVRVIPASGELTLTVTDSEIADDPAALYGTIPNGTIDAADPAYGRPNWAGIAKFMKVEETVGVVGATHALVKVLRS